MGKHHCSERSKVDVMTLYRCWLTEVQRQTCWTVTRSLCSIVLLSMGNLTCLGGFITREPGRTGTTGKIHIRNLQRNPQKRRVKPREMILLAQRALTQQVEDLVFPRMLKEEINHRLKVKEVNVN